MAVCEAEIARTVLMQKKIPPVRLNKTPRDPLSIAGHAKMLYCDVTLSFTSSRPSSAS